MHARLRRLLPAAGAAGAFGGALAAGAFRRGDGAEPQVALCEPTGRRDLRTLPKAHVHLHERSNAVRRETLQDLADQPNWRRGRQVALDAALSQTKGSGPRVDKYRRRAKLLSEKDPDKLIRACFGPAPPRRGASEEMVLASLRQLDAAPGPRSSVWDAQYVARALMESDPGSDARVLRELYEDAELESISWVEVCASLSITDGAIAPNARKAWRAKLALWAQLEREFRGRVGVRFTVHCPGSAADAKALLEFLDTTEHAKEAIVGVGQWGAERPASQRQAGYEVCCGGGRRGGGGGGALVAVNVHAGEHRCMGKRLFCAIFILKFAHLPRQARD